MKELPTQYEPKENEDKIYQLWEKSGYFNPDNLKTKKTAKTYTIAIPPPNVTGELHMGHALNAFIQDVLIRWKRMQGFKTLWVPGTDHAGIATQNVVEKKLKKEGLNRHILGKEKFLEKIWEWRAEYGNLILEQLKKMGSSCDWSRTAFTMDESYQDAVKAAFLHYYKKGWIYQGERVINWCVKCQTSLSDLELEHKEEKGHLWYIKYPQITVATTRPETMLGDTAVAVNPRDKRYKKLIGQKIILPLVGREIPIIADRTVDPEFGTGAVKVTPAHSMADAEIALRNNLPTIQVINTLGKMTEKAGAQFEGLSVLDARQKVVEELEKEGLLEKTEDYLHQIPHCYRCDRAIEPLVSQQWFLKMDELAKVAMEAVEGGKVKFHPKRWEKVYFDWLNNIRDWCISRQIWWGHKIPIDGVDDVLDTWFSSALWPFAVLGWPKKTKDLREFYPTDTVSTARDIINLWVSRMIFSGLEFNKKPPFKDVIIHATILNKDGQRMSKSLGTGRNPLELVSQYGADATRFGMIYQVLNNQDIKFAEENILMGKKFANKIWNASRFALQQIGNAKISVPDAKSLAKNKNLTAADKRILKKLSAITKKIDKNLENFQFGKAAHSLYDFFWHDFCDKYIEEAKKQDNLQTKKILAFVLLNSLKLLHPFMPFVTETIYQKLPFAKRDCLMVEEWPR
ncbi:valine--tRNA ligase [Patescibacteria group bacterium]|nr:valine--tRNA ligase [Patescibacteria group bacterium]MBU2579551.1 valine--tRNA ligase [Patescibacteria group bacterium]